MTRHVVQFSIGSGSAEVAYWGACGCTDEPIGAAS